MKAILISIKPEWVAKILNGEKTIEIRKTMPKCDLPIDVYIYCTKSNYFGYMSKRYIGKVVAKFTLNRVEELRPNVFALSGLSNFRYFIFRGEHSVNEKVLTELSCVSSGELDNYLKGNFGYAWHISNLEIFDEPKELSEFLQTKNRSLGKCYAPQSWCYIEV